MRYEEGREEARTCIATEKIRRQRARGKAGTTVEASRSYETRFAERWKEW